jgi:hypothetical protein
LVLGSHALSKNALTLCSFGNYYTLSIAQRFLLKHCQLDNGSAEHPGPCVSRKVPTLTPGSVRIPTLFFYSVRFCSLKQYIALPGTRQEGRRGRKSSVATVRVYVVTFQISSAGSHYALKIVPTVGYHYFPGGQHGLDSRALSDTLLWAPRTILCCTEQMYSKIGPPQSLSLARTINAFA